MRTCVHFPGEICLKGGKRKGEKEKDLSERNFCRLQPGLRTPRQMWNHNTWQPFDQHNNLTHSEARTVQLYILLQQSNLSISQIHAWWFRCAQCAVLRSPHTAPEMRVLRGSYATFWPLHETPAEILLPAKSRCNKDKTRDFGSQHSAYYTGSL